MWTVRDATSADAEAIARIHDRSWGGTAVSHGVVYDLSTLPALVCLDRAGDVVGVLTVHDEGDSLEVVSIDATVSGRGIGTALLEAAKARTISLAKRRLWLITTNDNLDALRFYQRRGLRLTSVAHGAVDRARVLKPAIPAVGAYGIEIHDELTLEWLAPTTATVGA